jgi:hypothetical protein
MYRRVMGFDTSARTENFKHICDESIACRQKYTAPQHFTRFHFALQSAITTSITIM